MEIDMAMQVTMLAAEDWQGRGTLAGLKPGESAKVSGIGVSGALRRRLLDLGLVENTEVRCVGVSPAGDPAAYLIRGAVIALRAADSVHIKVSRGDEQWD